LKLYVGIIGTPIGLLECFWPTMHKLLGKLSSAISKPCRGWVWSQRPIEYVHKPKIPIEAYTFLIVVCNPRAPRMCVHSRKTIIGVGELNNYDNL